MNSSLVINIYDIFHLGISFLSFGLMNPFSIPIDNDDIKSSTVNSSPLIVHCNTIHSKKIVRVVAHLYSGLFLFSAY